MDIFSSLPFPSGTAENSKIFLNLLEFTLPFGNGRSIETIDMVSPINPRFPATIYSTKNVIVVDLLYKAHNDRFITLAYLTPVTRNENSMGIF